MSIISLDHGAHWFNNETAKKWTEYTVFNGENQIPASTGDQWTHQVLYKTAKGTYVLHRWSQRQPETESYSIISKENAYHWLIENNHQQDVPVSYLTGSEL